MSISVYIAVGLVIGFALIVFGLRKKKKLLIIASSIILVILVIGIILLSNALITM
jgi:hypothetical protein